LKCSCNFLFGFAPRIPATVDCLTRHSCGNGVITRNTGEQCDGGVGCHDCACIAGYKPPVLGHSTTCQPICGDGVTVIGEECDGGLMCSACKCSSPGYGPTNPLSGSCESICGDSIIVGTEQCDGGAGCTACKCDTGYASPSPDNPFCQRKF